MDAAICHHTIVERSKYPDHNHSENFSFEDILISAEAAKNIRPTVRRWRRIYCPTDWSVTEEGIYFTELAWRLLVIVNTPTEEQRAASRILGHLLAINCTLRHSVGSFSWLR